MFAQNTNFDALLILYSQPNWNNHSSHHMIEIKNMKAVCVHSHFRNRISRYNKQYDIFDSQIKRNVTYLSRYLQHELYVLARRSHSILVIMETKDLLA